MELDSIAAARLEMVDGLRGVPADFLFDLLLSSFRVCWSDTPLGVLTRLRRCGLLEGGIVSLGLEMRVF